MFTGLSEMWHETCAQGYQKCEIRHVHRVIRNVTWDMCTGLSEMWDETCAQGYQKCDMIHVHRIIRMWNRTCAQGYQKCDVIHVHRVIRMWFGTCAQGYQKCDMRHVHRVIRNVAWDMCTGLSEILIYNEQPPPLLGALCICIPSYRHNNISIVVTDN